MIDGKKQEISFENGEELTLGNLIDAIEAEFNIHRSRQKLIFGGKSLTDENAKLSSYGVKSGSKIMLLGRVWSFFIFLMIWIFKVELADPDEIHKLNELEGDFASAKARIASLETSSTSFVSNCANVISFSQLKTHLTLLFGNAIFGM